MTKRIYDDHLMMSNFTQQLTIIKPFLIKIKKYISLGSYEANSFKKLFEQFN